MNTRILSAFQSVFTILLIVMAFLIAKNADATRPKSYTETEEVNVYLDCKTWCDVNYIKREISFVNYVVDRFDANVYLMISGRQTGAGGLEVS